LGPSIRGSIPRIPIMTLTPEQIAAIHFLAGTSGVYDAGACEEAKIALEDLEEVAELAGIFRCESCGWWCDEDEDTGDNICEDCSKEG
jgi:hypothetical protein